MSRERHIRIHLKIRFRALSVTGNNEFVTNRLLLVRITVAAGLLAGMGLSFPLWLTRTDYPRVPAIDIIPGLPRPLDILLLSVFALALGLLVWKPELKWSRGLLFGIAVLLILQDQSRLQPWFVEYVLLLAAAVYSRRDRAATHTCCLILAAVYVWSGVHKMNSSFLTNLFPWLVSPFVKSSASRTMNAIGASIPFIEIGMGLALLRADTRRVGVITIVGMHVFLLIVLSPLALGWNSVVAPWNVAMIVLVPGLFWNSGASAKELLTVGRIYWIPLLVLPLLSLVGLWDTNPSFALYSGNQIIGSVVLSPEAREKLDPRVKALTESFGDLYRLRLDDWSMAATNVPAYPAERVLRRLAQTFCPLHVINRNDVIFVLEQPPPWLYRSGWHRIEAAEQFCK
jgi:hypothetical protein